MIVKEKEKIGEIRANIIKEDFKKRIEQLLAVASERDKETIERFYNRIIFLVKNDYKHYKEYRALLSKFVVGLSRVYFERQYI